MAAEIRVRAPSLTRTEDGRWRVAAEIDGEEIYVVAEVPLVANGDAWAAMTWLSATATGATLRIATDLDRRLAENLDALQAIPHHFWGHKPARVVADRLVDRTPSGGDAMLFTCGVDSFYALLKSRHLVDRLIFARGVNANVPERSDEAHWQLVRRGVAAVAEDRGIPVIYPETNLRRHPVIGRVGWERSHLAVTAGLVHTMTPTISRIHIAGAEARLPIGSDPILDPLWGSSALELVGEGWEATRLDKVRAIADWPMVHKYLSVCFGSRGDALNCGVCQKCVSTQLRFHIAGARDRLEVFPRTPLLELIDGVPWLAPFVVPYWVGLMPYVEKPLRDAIARLLTRRRSPAEWLQGRALWMRKTSVGRKLRRMAKRLLVERPTPVPETALSRSAAVDRADAN
jgi:hypothetical protein